MPLRSLPNLALFSSLKETEGLKYVILPNSEKEMRLDSDFIKGMPALSKEFWSGGLKVGRYFTEIGYNNQVEKLKEKVMSRVCDIDMLTSRNGMDAIVRTL